uniref:RNA-directed DNA polymerase n=1 Tax=Strongyloides stercoralis TaxID=6248 RepID=A0A0K0EBX9_STRER
MFQNKASLLYNLLPDDVIQEVTLNVGTMAEYPELKAFLLKRYGATRSQDRARLLLKTFTLDPNNDKFEQQLKQLCSIVYDISPGASPTTLFSFQQTIICQALTHDDRLWDLAFSSKTQNHFELIDELVAYQQGKANQRKSKNKRDTCRIHPNSKHTTQECRQLNNEKLQQKNSAKFRPSFSSNKTPEKEARCNQITTTKPDIHNDLRVPVTIYQSETQRKCVAYVDGGSQKTLILQKIANELGLHSSKSNLSILSFDDVITPTMGSTLLNFTIGQRSYEFLFYIVESLPDPYSQVFLSNDFLAAVNADVLHRSNGSALRINDDTIPNIEFSSTTKRTFIQVSRVITQNQEQVKARIRQEFPSVVSKHKFDIGKCPVKLDPIIIKDKELPPYHRYDVPFKLRSEVQRQISELLSFDVIRPTKFISQSFNLVCAPKKDNTVRTCIDLRPLNSVIACDRYHTKTIPQILREFQSFTFVSNIDLTQSYLQLELNDKDKNIISFRFNNHNYAYNRLPFGLKTAPAPFQKTIDSILQSTGAWSYQGDIILTTRGSADHHVGELIKVIQCLQENNLKINLDKSSFLGTECCFLGFNFSTNFVSPQSSYVQAILDYKVPTSIFELRRFRGLCSYLCPFLSNTHRYETHTNSLISSTSKKVSKKTIDIPAAVLNEIQLMKHHISSIKSLVYPNYDLPFYLFTDASISGVGAMLSQPSPSNPKEYCPLAFFSKKFSELKRTTPPCYLEIKGISLSLSYFKEYLLGSNITVFTDHKNLETLTAQSTDFRLHKYLFNIQQFSPTIVWIPGQHNVVADALSRCFSTKSVPPVSASPSSSSRREESLGLLPTDKLTLTVTELPEVCSTIHGNTHFGTLKALNLASSYFNFSQKEFKEIYSSIVNNCISCQKSIPRNEPTIESRLVACGLPRYSYTIDLCGPLNKASSSVHHRYIILAIDTATRYLMFTTTDNTSSENLAQKIRNDILFLFGKPVVLRLDNAKYFKGHEFLDSISKEGIKLRFGTPYAYTSQTLIERSFRIVHEGIRKLLQNQPDNWDLMLPRVIYLHNHAPNSLGFVLAQLFMRDFSTPVLPNNVTPSTQSQTTLKQDIAILNTLLDIQKKLLGRQCVINEIYKVGDSILVRDRNPKISKFNYLYKGPFTVTKADFQKVHYKAKTGKEKIAYYKDCKSLKDKGSND